MLHKLKFQPRTVGGNSSERTDKNMASCMFKPCVYTRFNVSVSSSDTGLTLLCQPIITNVF